MAASGIITPYATLSFAHLFTPRPRAEGGEPVYSCSLLFSKTDQQTPEYKALQVACMNLAKERFPGMQVRNLRLPFRDAAEKAGQYQGYEPGVMYVSPWSKLKPGIVDIRLQDVLDPAEVWAGQTVRAYLSPFAWTNSGKSGVSFGLQHIQIVKKDMPRIDGRLPANKAFSALEDNADELESIL